MQVSLKGGKKLFLVCTGLGRVNRGFESYIADLAEKLTEEMPADVTVTVFSGAVYIGKNFQSVHIPSISRNNKIVNFFLSAVHVSVLELYTFFIAFVPFIIFQRPRIIYLGEYKLYCFLFKLRKLLRLQFNLVLYTGGQAVPGLFNVERDYTHHVTDIYYGKLIQQNIPAVRQFVIPHFINDDFVYNEMLAAILKTKAGNKKIVLTVGYIDKAVKRMDLFVQLLAEHATSVFPILLGEPSADTEAIGKMLTDHFGKDGYILDKVPRKELGSYYGIADLFMLCSPKESFGLASVEALYFGKPVLCSDFYEAHFVLQSHASFVDMHDETATQNLINQLLYQKADHQEIENRKMFVKENYTWGSLSGKYLSMFSKMMSN